MIFGDVLKQTQKVQDRRKTPHNSTRLTMLSTNLGPKTFAKAVKHCKILAFTNRETANKVILRPHRYSPITLP